MGLFDIFKKKLPAQQPRKDESSNNAAKMPGDSTEESSSLQQLKNTAPNAEPKKQCTDKSILSKQDILEMALKHEPDNIYQSGGYDLTPAVSNIVGKILPEYKTFCMAEAAILFDNPDRIMENIRQADIDSLFIFLKFLIIEAREAEHAEIIENVQNYLITVLQQKLSASQTSTETSEFEQLQKKCCLAMKQNPDAEDTKKLVQELGKKILTLDKIYVAYDMDFNRQFPYIGIDGRIEVSTQSEIAKSLQSYYHEQHLGHIFVREFERNEIEEILRSYQRMGLLALRLDNGTWPVDIWFGDILETSSDNLLEKHNRSIRGMFLRELQYGYRLRKMDNHEKDSKMEENLKGMMLMMRNLAFRDLGSGLCWVLASKPYKAGTTFYTKKALAKAMEMLAKDHLPESALIAEGDNDIAVYHSSVKLLGAHKPGQPEKEGFVCAFTGRRETEMIRTYFAQNGEGGNPLVITYDELCSQALQYSGILIDMPTYGRELPNAELADVDHIKKLSVRS